MRRYNLTTFSSNTGKGDLKGSLGKKGESLYGKVP